MQITQKLIKEYLHYEPLTGIFTWIKKPSQKIILGSKAGYAHKQRGGYINIGFKGMNLKAHRLAFLYMTGIIPSQVDHEDHNRSNNIWSNLKPATQTISSRNCTLQKNNTSGVVGVSWNKQRKRWIAMIWHNSKPILLGRFVKKADAVLARQQAEIKYGYHPNHGK